MKLRHIAILVLAGTSGCASTPNEPEPIDPIFIALEQAATSIDRELKIISERQQVREPNQNEITGDNEVLGKQIASFDYAGPIDGALTSIAELVGYRFVNNRSSAFPVTVMIDDRDTNLLELLRSVGAQAGTDVDVVVSERYQEIRLEDK